MAVPTEAIPEGVSEQEILIELGNLASQSLVIALQGKRGHHYVLTPNLYARETMGGPSWRGTSSVSANAKGGKFPNGLKEFVGNALKEPDCNGLVPLTDIVARQLEEEGLHPIEHGFMLDPENVKFELYGR